MAVPRFGDYVENAMASVHNPRRVGRFVREVHVTGRMNRGTWWECTDGRGDFWQVKPGNCAISTEHPADIGVLRAEVERLRPIAQRAREVAEAWRKLRPYRPQMAALLVRPLDDLAGCYPYEIDQALAAMADEAACRFEEEAAGEAS